MINSNFGFTPLKEVWLGDCYPESWYDHLPNEIADPFRQITQWTKEDTGKLQKFLESRGIQVVRPTFDSIDNYTDDTGNLVKPPICPRDEYIVLGNTLYSLQNTLKKDPWHHIMDEYTNNGFDVQNIKDQPMNCISPPCVVRMGKDLYVDFDIHHAMWGYVCEWLVNTSRNYRVNITNTYGHSDAVFCPVAPGLLVSSHYKQDYNQTFPNWKVYQIPNNLHNSSYNKRLWTVSDKNIDNNKTFNQFIQSTAADWVGDFKETVYEVNMLVIDEKNVIAMKEYPPLFKWLADHGITVHLFDFKTRSFWDGGWHCLTLDIHREDTKQDLFPSRGNCGVSWRLN